MGLMLRIMTVYKVQILRIARSNQEHIHHSVHVSLLSRTVSVLKISRELMCMTSPPTVVIMLYEIYIMVLPTDKWDIGSCRHTGVAPLDYIL